ncbi:PH domain-containing protein [Candidatus Woesearchaeota archaeon]|nr:PH domain-containing protein [Candidatus Woesearchaeota archaeon]
MAEEKTHENAEKPEKVIKVVKKSRKSLFFTYFLVVMFFYLAYYSWFIRIRSKMLDVFASLFLLAGIFIWTYGEFKIRYKKLAISNKRAVLQEGIFHRHDTTIRYAGITEVTAKQSFMQRLLGYGDLTIMTSSAKKDYELSIESVPSPFRVKGLLEHFIFAEHKV